MAQVLNNLFGGGKPSPDHVAAPAGDSGMFYLIQFMDKKG